MSDDERVEMWRTLARRRGRVIMILCIAVMSLVATIIINAGKCHP